MVLLPLDVNDLQISKRTWRGNTMYAFSCDSSNSRNEFTNDKLHKGIFKIVLTCMLSLVMC